MITGQNLPDIVRIIDGLFLIGGVLGLGLIVGALFMKEKK